LAYLLRNRFYIGEVVYGGGISPGEHEPILSRDLFEAVQEKLGSQRQRSGKGRAPSQALLMGKLYDDRGNRMSPSHANKAGARYRYYVSCALHQGRAEEAGSVARVSAPEIEATIVRALRERAPEESDGRALIEMLLDRAVVRPASIDVILRRDVSEPETSESADPRAGPDPVGLDVDQARDAAIISIPWSRPCSTRRREIIQLSDSTREAPRPMRSETRATLVRAIALGRRWLSEIVNGSISGAEAIAEREGCSKRHVAMMISLAFLSPELVKAATDGQLPRGISLRDLTDPPLAWSRQHHMLGI
jgi:hypothetical protein